MDGRSYHTGVPRSAGSATTHGASLGRDNRILEHVARHPAEFALVQVSVRSFAHGDGQQGEAG